MASCCTGVTECESVITIGYLKGFIGSDVHSSSDDSPLYVNGSDDSYCPTYGELAGGSLIKIHEDGASPNKDVDGIIVGGGYSSDQCVNISDLSMVYTRFKEFKISASPTEISECGGSSSFSYIHKYTRYTKTHAGGCESINVAEAEVSDTDDSEVTWDAGAYGSISYPTYTIEKNGSISSNSRSTTVTGKIKFRGAEHSDTASIYQNALTGGYTQFVKHEAVVYSYDSYSISPNSFDCAGGDWYGTGVYTNHEWDVYSWVDSCGENYPSVTENRNDAYPSYTESYGSGSVSSIDCSSISSDVHYSGTASYKGGLSDSWEQYCESCGGCNDYEDYYYYPVIADCADGSAVVDYDYTGYTASADTSGVCHKKESYTGSSSYIVTWDCNGYTDDPYVTVTGAPCCSSACTEYEYEVDASDYEENFESCGGDFTITVTGKYRCKAPIEGEWTDWDEWYTDANSSDGDIASPGGFSSPIPVSVSKNCTSENRSCDISVEVFGLNNEPITSFTVTVLQDGGPCEECGGCTPCTCYVASDATGTAKWDDESATVKYTLTSNKIDEDCNVITSETEETATVTFEKNDECSGATRTGIISTTYKKCGDDNKCLDENIYVNWTVEQEAHAGKEGCSCTACTCYAVGDATGTAKWDDESATVNFSCTATTIDSGCNVTTAVTEESATVTFAKNDECSSATRTGSLTWTGHKTCDGSNKCSDTDVTISWTVEQAAHSDKPGCSCTACTCYAVGDATGTAKWDDESATVNFSCTATTIDSGCNVTTAVTEETATVTFAKNDECSSATRTGSLTWTGHKTCDGSNKCSDTDVTISWTVEQAAHSDKPGCSCTACTCYAVGDATGTAKWDDESATVKFSCTATTIDSDCNVTTAVTEESATVTFAKNDTCKGTTRTGNLTWTGHKTCDGSNKCSDTDVTISWTVEQAAHAGKTIPISADGTLDCNGGTVTFTAT